MADTVDGREEQQLLDAVKTATDLAAKGMTPDAAVEKVARDNGFGPGKIRLIGQAFNNGQQLAQWRQPAGTSILDKIASFELCDPQKVIDNIYKGPTPSEKAAADRLHKDYLLPPTWADKGQEKKASTPLPRLPQPEAYKPDPAEALNHAYGRIDRAKQAADETRRKAAAETDAVMQKVASLVTYFKQASHARLPFAVVESAAREYYGDPGAGLMDMVYQRARLSEKRAGATPPVLKAPLNMRAEPFTLIKAAIDTAGRASMLKAAYADLVKTVERAKVEELRPFSNAGSPAVQPAATGPWSKEAASIFGTEKQAFGVMTEIGAIAAGDILAHKATHKEENEDPYGDVRGIDSEIDAIRRQAAQAGKRRGMKKQAFLGAGIGTAIGSTLGRQMGTVGSTTGDLVDDQWMKLEDPEHENELRKIKAHAMINQLMTDPDDPISGHDPDKVLAAYNEIAQATPRVAENIATLRPQLRKQLEGHREPFEAKEMLDIEHGLAKSKLPTPNTSILGETPEKILG